MAGDVGFTPAIQFLLNQQVPLIIEAGLGIPARQFKTQLRCLGLEAQDNLATVLL